MVVFVIADVRKTIDDLKKVMKNFESRVEFTEDLQKMSDVSICFQSPNYFFKKSFHTEKIVQPRSKLLEVSNAFKTSFLGCVIALTIILIIH